MATSACVLSRHTMSAIGVGQPDCMLIATASGTAAITASASDSVMRGRFWSLRHSSSSKRPMRIGVLLTWKVFAPMSALARFSFTYAFMPEMIATTATRNATDTMMPSSVKKERSLLTRICSRAVVITSMKRMDLISGGGEGRATPLLPASLPERPRGSSGSASRSRSPRAAEPRRAGPERQR